jgi:hypothetical protein
MLFRRHAGIRGRCRQAVASADREADVSSGIGGGSACSGRPHRALDQAAPLRPLPDRVTNLDLFRIWRHDRAGGVIHEYHLVA